MDKVEKQTAAASDVTIEARVVMSFDVLNDVASPRHLLVADWSSIWDLLGGSIK